MFTNVMNEQKDKSYSKSDFDLSGKTLISVGALKEALVSDMSIPALKKVNMVSAPSNNVGVNNVAAPSMIMPTNEPDITMKSDASMPSEHVNKFVPEGSSVPNIPVMNEMPMQEIVPEPQVTSETPLETTSENKFVSPEINEPVSAQPVNPVFNTLVNAANKIPEPQVEPEVSAPSESNMFTPHIPVIEEQNNNVAPLEETKEPTVEPVMESVTSLDDIKLGQEEPSIPQSNSITDDLQSGSFVDDSGEVKSEEDSLNPSLEPVSAPSDEVNEPVSKETTVTEPDSTLSENMPQFEPQAKTQVEPKSEPQAKTQVEPKAEPQVETQEQVSEEVSGDIFTAMKEEHLKNIETLSNGINTLLKDYLNNMKLMYSKLEKMVLESRKTNETKNDMENAMGMLSNEELDKAVDRWDGKIDEATNYGIGSDIPEITPDENTRAI